MAKKYGWPYAHPPNCDFDINTASDQAKGLVFWLPLMGPRTLPLLDRVRRQTLTAYNSPIWTPDGWIGSALLFDDESLEYLRAEYAPVTGPPMTLAAWFNTDNITTTRSILQIADASTNINYFGLFSAGGAAGDPVRLSRYGGASNNHLTTTDGFSANKWHHACAMLMADNDVAVAIDGGGKATSSVSISPTGIDRVCVGAGAAKITPGDYFSGRIMDVRIYNVGKSDADVVKMCAPRTRWDLFRPRMRLFPVNVDISEFIDYDVAMRGVLSGVMGGAR